MNNMCKFSNVTKNYLYTFHEIFDKMKRGMTEVKLSQSISHNFILQMIPHHQAAIEMSKNILRYTTNIPLQNIAASIIKEQTQSIKNMRAIECACSDVHNTEKSVHLYQQQVDKILKTMFTGMGNAPEINRINCDFMYEMIPHHQGAVSLSKHALQFDICPGLKPILQSIITSQEKGIKQMNSLLKFMNCPCQQNHKS